RINLLGHNFLPNDPPLAGLFFPLCEAAFSATSGSCLRLWSVVLTVILHAKQADNRAYQEESAEPVDRIDDSQKRLSPGEGVVHRHGRQHKAEPDECARKDGVFDVDLPEMADDAREHPGHDEIGD